MSVLNRQQKAANFEGAGGGNGTDPRVLLASPIVPQDNSGVNRLDTTLVGCTPVAWSAMDAIHGLAHILVERGLVTDGPDLRAAIATAWQAVGTASYLSLRDLEAWPEMEKGKA